MLSFDDPPSYESGRCPHCDRPITTAKGFLNRDDSARAIYLAALEHHDGNEAWIDLIFSSDWGDQNASRVTVGCRVGPVEGSDEPGATVVDAAETYPDSPTFGYKLSRDEALAEPLLDEVWEIVDFVLQNDAVVRRHVYGGTLRFAPTPRQGQRRAVDSTKSSGPRLSILSRGPSCSGR